MVLTLIENLSILANGREVDSCNYANHVVNIKNLLEYNPSYTQSATVNCEIPLNRYSFFEALEDTLLPNTKIELNIEIEKDANLIFKAADDCRVIITRLQLFIPKLTFNSEGQKLYMENYLKPYKWTYLNEVVERSNNSQQQTGHFRITNAISKPRHVLVFGIDTARIDSETANPFLYDTFEYQIMLIYQDVILKLQMETNIQIFT